MYNLLILTFKTNRAFEFKICIHIFWNLMIYVMLSCFSTYE